MKKRRHVPYLSVALLVFVAATAAAAENSSNKSTLSIIQPEKQSQTYQNIVKLKARALSGGGMRATINGEVTKINDNGFFEAMLLLHPGKNLAKVSLLENSKLIKEENVKILKTMRFSDSDKLYGNKVHWANKEILNLATLGIIESPPDGNFSPNKEATSGEFATWLAKTYSLSTKTPKYDLFSDVPREHWRAPYIERVTEKGWMKSDANYFGINDGMTRLDAVKIMIRAEGINETGDSDKEYFSDVPPQSDENKILGTAFLAGLIKGVEKSQFPRFQPDRNVTKAEVVTLLSRTKALRNEISELDDWSKGFGKSSLCNVHLPPDLLSVSCSPETVSAGGQGTVKILATISGKDVAQVKADLTQLKAPDDVLLMSEEQNKENTENTDRIFSLVVPIDASISPGEKEISVIIMDSMGMEDSKSAVFNVYVPNPPAQILSAIAYPPFVKAGTKGVFAVKVYDPDGLSDIDSVIVDLSEIKGSPQQLLFDLGVNGDVKSGDGIYMFETIIPAEIVAGEIIIPVLVRGKNGSTVSGKIPVTIR